MRATTPPTQEEIRERWAPLAQTPGPRPATPPPAPLNLQHVMDLGGLVFFHFRGRAYGIPPLDMDTGEHIQRLIHDLRAATQLDKGSGLHLVRADRADSYYTTLRSLRSTLWRHCRPVGRIRRLLKALRILPNHFRLATEADLGNLAGFMSRLRMSTSVVLPEPQAHRALGTY